MELEQFGKGHAAARFDVVIVLLGLVPEKHRLRDREQAMVLPYLVRQQIFQLVGEGKRRLDPTRDPLGAETANEVVLGHQATHSRRGGVFKGIELFVMRVLHLKVGSEAFFDQARQRYPIPLVELPCDEPLVEPGDAQCAATVIADHGFGQLDPLLFRNLRLDRLHSADHRCLGSDNEAIDGRGPAIRLPAERKSEQQVANRLDTQLVESLGIGLANVR